MQDLVGIVRREEEMERALGELEELKRRARKVAVTGNREYNGGWHTALDLQNLADGVGNRHASALSSARRAAGRNFRDDYPSKNEELGRFTYRRALQRFRRTAHNARATRPMPGELEQVIAEMKCGKFTMATATFRIWRGGNGEGEFRTYTIEISPGMVVLDAVHHIQAEQANDLAVRWNCKAGKCGSCSAEINGNPRLMCMTPAQLSATRPAGDD